VPFVLDASAAIEAVADDEVGPVGAAVLERLRQDRAVVPAIWAAEVANAILNGWHAGRLSEEAARSIVEVLTAAPVDTAPPGELRWSVVEAAQVTGLTTYDAAYLVLAVETGLELATCDQQLRAAAERAGVACI
jgi:predicted nucleic acid-binding protein